MKKYILIIITQFLFLFTSLTPSTVLAREPEDKFHPIKVETIKSNLAKFNDVHVHETEQGVEISGQLLRRVGNRHKKVKGHIHIEVLGSNEEVLNIVRLQIKSNYKSPKRDRRRDFSTVLPSPNSKIYNIRVSHNVGEDMHGNVK